jgi:DNA repair exonuclease SbcCD ATPase subunit
MIISEISIKGFKSYGNNTQTLKLNTEKGELILLTGSNGNGKSSFIESFEYVLYGKVKSAKKKKWATLSTLPNRINNELLNNIKFISNNNEIEITRGINPSILKLIENGIDNDKAGKSNIESKIEKYVDMDIETFKSFISMSINDFKNFISLSNEEKQLLLDKLFNLEVINILNSILKDINKDNKSKIIKFNSEISVLEDSINSIKNSIQKSIEKEKLNIQSEIDTIKSDMESKKDEYITLKSKVDKIKEKDIELRSEMDKEKEQYIILSGEIKSAQKDLDLYDSGKCFTCGTDFNNEYFKSLKDILLEKKESLLKLKIEIETNISAIKEKQNKLQDISSKINKAFDDITYLLKSYKLQIDKLSQKKDSESDIKNSNTSEFENTIIELKGKIDISAEEKTKCTEKENYYKELSKIFGEDGVKKSIIASIIKPINHFIKENIKKMNLPFEVQLDETFTAKIKQLGSDIEHDSLSTGENKLININILISYLMMIKTKKFINILFLDEVFSSIDLENIEKIIILLKHFSEEFKVNIFVVHHAILNQELFDRIIQIDKNIFTTINELK